MSFLVTVLAVAVASGATTWMGFRCTRESRKLLAEKREEEARKAEIKMRESLENQRRAAFNQEFLEMLDAVLRNPEQYCNTTSFQRASKFPHVSSLVDQFRNWEQMGRTNRSQEKQITDLSKTVRELRAEVKEVHRAMALNTGDF